MGPRHKSRHREGSLEKHIIRLLVPGVRVLFLEEDA